MATPLFVRMTGAIGLLALGGVIVGLSSFLSVDPTAWAGLSGRVPAVSVDREFKGDRLPISSRFNDALLNKQLRLRSSPPEIPVGCDASFSPISAPRLAYIYGRCST